MLSVSDLGHLSQYTSGTAKRRRLNDAPDKFRPGYIMKVTIRNFTTYNYAEFNLSPSLNMIIGPNGTGKSTLVAAICLGLGGKLDLIKRKSMKSMIKSGETKGAIEITMKDVEGNPPIRIQRTFTEKESTWTMNSRTTTEKAVKLKCKALNIQLDNLCHFLPQERVAEFAGLSPEKLLLETERTLGDGHLLEQHENLISIDEEKHTLDARINNLQEVLSKLQEEKDGLEEEAQKYKEYERVTANLSNHIQLLPFAQLSDLKKKQGHLKQQKDEAKANLVRFKSEVSPILDASQGLHAILKEKSELLEEIKDSNNDLKNKFTASKSEYEAISLDIDKLIATADALTNKSADKRKQLEKLRAEREQLVRSRSKIQVVDDNELKELVNTSNARKDLIDAKNSQLETLNDSLARPHNIIKMAMNDCKRYEDKLNSKDKLDVLEPTPRYHNPVRDGSYKAHVELRAKPAFKGLYCEAPVVCCDVSDKTYAHYLEKVIDNNTLFSITVSSQENYRKITDYAFNEKKLNFPVRFTNQREKPKPPMSPEQLRSYGFSGFLSDFLIGPDEVLNMLYDTSKIHMIPVSKRNLNDVEIKKLTSPAPNDSIPFRKFIAGDLMFTVQRSNYGSRQLFYSTEKINPRSYYFGTSGLTSEAKQDLQERILESKHREREAKIQVKSTQDEIKLVDDEKSVLLHESDTLKSRIDELRHLKSQQANLEGRINSKEEAIRTLVHESQKDYTDKINQVKVKIQEKYSGRCDKMTEIAEYSRQLSESEVKLNLAELQILQAQNRDANIKDLIGEIEGKLEELSKIVQETKRKYNEIKNSPAANEIRKQSEKYTPEQKEILSSLAKDYMEKETFTEDHIREKIQQLENEKSIKSTADQSSIESLKRKNDEISRAENELPRIMERRDNLASQISLIRQTWEPELTELVEKISVAFNKRFTKVASDGRVELAKSEKFQDWKLQILVKFRQESELKVLDHQSQSGGERAVSTIFFIMALQGLTDAPLRVVDEINQGMDPKNEKMAHRYLVHTACQNNKSQYFLVTPKLLTGLYYHPDMVVHCIYTGPFIGPVEKNSQEPDYMDFVRVAG